jgi:response regulator RpfG family c-di-GMP phosphodiesterase
MYFNGIIDSIVIGIIIYINTILLGGIQLEENVKEVKNELGVVKVTEDVVAIIAGIAASEVAGVSNMSGGIAGGIAEAFGRKTLSKGVKVEVGEKEAAIDLYVIIEYGARIPEVDIRKLKEGGYLHDIGKIVLDPKLLNKNYQLTVQEENEVKNHSIVGYRILNSSERTVDLAELVLAHHEQWDGGGYPKGLKGEEIPLLARIITIAETYDRMIHPSQCNEAMSKTDALCSIRENAGVLFDPQLAEIFVNMIEKSG